MRNITPFLAMVLVCACHAQRPPSPPESLETLTGTVIQKPWSKTHESWNAGGSEYYVLKVEGSLLPPERRTAEEGVILLPSDEVPFERLKGFVGRGVTCQGEFIHGEPYKPPKGRVEQMPAPLRDPFTGEVHYPIRGKGFKVYVINLGE